MTQDKYDEMAEEWLADSDLRLSMPYANEHELSEGAKELADLLRKVAEEAEIVVLVKESVLEEREACAKVASDQCQIYQKREPKEEYWKGRRDEACWIAERIRSRE